MRTIYKFGVYLALFCAAIPIFAQARIIDKKEYDSIYQKSRQLLENRAYRSTSISEEYKGAGSPETRTSVYEFVPPDRYHSVFSWTDSKGLRKIESITIGDRMWSRMDDGLWNVAGSGTGSGTGSGFGGQLIERMIEYKGTSGVKVGTETADLYQFTVINKFTSGNDAFETGSTERRWFNTNGSLLKSENISTRDGNPTYSSTVTYEYDPKIKIEAPEVLGKTKSN